MQNQIKNNIESYNVDTDENGIWESVDPNIFRDLDRGQIVKAGILLAFVILMFIGFVVLYFM